MAINGINKRILASNRRSDNFDRSIKQTPFGCGNPER